MVTKQLGSAELLFNAADEMGLRPSWLKQRSIFAIPTIHGERYINYSTSGSNSHDVHIVELPEELVPFDVQKYIFEEYAPGKELRYLLLNNRIIGVHESQYGESVAEDRHLKRISYPRADWDPVVIALSLKVARVFGLRFAAVDYIVGPDGRARILEVNSSPGMKWFHAPTSGPTVDVARLFLQAMLDDRRSDIPVTSDSLVTSPTKRIVKV